jgi:hypothetical protein
MIYIFISNLGELANGKAEIEAADGNTETKRSGKANIEGQPDGDANIEVSDGKTDIDNQPAKTATVTKKVNTKKSVQGSKKSISTTISKKSPTKKVALNTSKPIEDSSEKKSYKSRVRTCCCTTECFREITAQHTSKHCGCRWKQNLDKCSADCDCPCNNK